MHQLTQEIIDATSMQLKYADIIMQTCNSALHTYTLLQRTLKNLRPMAHDPSSGTRN